MAIDTRAMSIELAVEYHRAGKLPQAEQIYRSILAKDRDHVDANYLLGLIELERGRSSTAAILIGRARDLFPNNPLYHFNLGRALQGEGRNAEAETSFRKAIHHRNDYIEARYSLGLLLQTMGRNDDAVIEYKKLLRIKPDIAAVYNNLGNALMAAKRYDEALKNLRKAVELSPDYSEGWGNLGNLLQTIGQLDEAVTAFRRSLEINPDSAANHYNFGNLQQTLCNYEAAEAEYLAAVRLKPDFAGAYNNLGNIYKLLGRLKDSLQAFDNAIRIEPNSADPHNNKGNALVAGGDINAAIVSYRKAVELQPGYVDAWSNLVYALNYPSGLDDGQIFADHREWSKRFEWPVEVETIPPARPLEGRKLRIGYVSGDFRRHSVAFFFEPLLEAHDRSRCEIYCYANIRFSDEVTQRIMNSCDGWRPITNLDDNQAAQLIRKDQIDVLVDLSGHTDGNRLLIFARRPAPVQVSWLGYPNTTGLNNMDYRLIDAVTDPPGRAD
jgi:predicted O-linked N-acetylglucosamine transferase (SPINDLY family)